MVNQEYLTLFVTVPIRTFKKVNWLINQVFGEKFNDLTRLGGLGKKIMHDKE